jgi:ABC transporter substrate binding protein
VLTLYASPEGAPEGLKDGLRALGYIEGQNVVIDWRSVAGKYDQLGALVTDLVRLKVDVIVADVTRAVLAAKQATTTIPIVFTIAADPVGNGLVSSHRMLDPTARHQREAVATSHRSRPCGLARRRALESRYSLSQDPVERG